MKWTLWLIVVFSLLIGLFPQRAFAGELPSMILSSDNTWKASRTVTVGWKSKTFDDSYWKAAAAPSIGTCTLGREKPSFTTPMWYPQPAEFQTVYFRKSFYVNKKPLSATMKVAFDDDGDVYINGTKALTDSTGKTESVALEKDVSEYIMQGENTIAIRVIDKKGGCQWAQALFDLYIDEYIHIEMPVFKQMDPLWEGETYAGGLSDKLTCGDTIGGCGCATTSLAMVLRAYGIQTSPDGFDTTPKILNDYFRKNQTCTFFGCISKGYVFGNVRWSAIHEYTKKAYDLYGSQKLQFGGYKDFDSEYMKGLLEAGSPVVAKSPFESHWFVVRGTTADSFEIADPLYDESTLATRYQNTAGRLVSFKKVNSDFSQIEVFVQAPFTIRVSDTEGHSTGYDSTRGVVEEIPNSFYAYDNFPETATKGLHWVHINNPKGGLYTISTEAPNTAVYVADSDSDEIYTIVQNSNFLIDFNPDEVEKSSIHENIIQACLASDEGDGGLRDIIIPVNVETENLLGTPKVFKGSLRF